MESDVSTSAEVMFTTLLILLGIYMIPFGIAITRKHGSAGGIFFVNLLLGWTILGWIWALVWACSATHQRVEVIYKQEPPSQ